MGNIILSKLLVIGIIFLLYYAGIKFIIYFLPFILGWLLSILIEPLVSFLHIRMKIFRGFASFLSIILFISGFGLIITLLGGVLFSELTKLSNHLPQLTNQLKHYLIYLTEQFELFYINISPSIMDSLSNALSNILNSLTRFVGFLAASAVNFLTAIPNVFIFIIVTLISAFFISKDKEKIRRFIRTQFPVHLLRHKNIQILKDDLVLALLGYIKAQLILMIITFAVGSIGLYIIGINYAVLISLGVSVLDALPIFGSGSIYIPWIISRLILKDFKLALFLGIVYLSITLTRQTLEPKILGTQIGLYPLVTLMSMYIGLKVLGFSGLILGPIIVISLSTFQKTGLLPKWKSSEPKSKL